MKRPKKATTHLTFFSTTIVGSIENSISFNRTYKNILILQGRPVSIGTSTSKAQENAGEMMNEWSETGRMNKEKWNRGDISLERGNKGKHKTELHPGAFPAAASNASRETRHGNLNAQASKPARDHTRQTKRKLETASRIWPGNLTPEAESRRYNGIHTPIPIHSHPLNPSSMLIWTVHSQGIKCPTSGPKNRHPLGERGVRNTHSTNANLYPIHARFPSSGFPFKNVSVFA